MSCVVVHVVGRDEAELRFPFLLISTSTKQQGEGKDMDEHKFEYAVVGGSSLLESSFCKSLTLRVVETELGNVNLYFGPDFIFCQRHHADPAREYTQPHNINYRAIALALKKEGVSKVISFGSVGSLRKDIRPGTVVIPDDYFNLWNIISLYDDARAHLVAEINAELRQEIINVLKEHKEKLPPFELREGGTYVQTRGPRFETKAEIKVLAGFGELVAMTGAHEVTIYTEGGLKVAMVNMVDNMGNGLGDTTLSFAEFKEGVRKNEATVEAILGVLLTHFLKRK